MTTPTMPRPQNPQLTREDLEDIRDTRGDFMSARAIPVDFIVRVPTGTDPHFGTPRYSEKIVQVPAVVQKVEESDRLLRLGGRLKTGDIKLVVQHSEITRVGLGNLRYSVVVVPAGPSGTRYFLDVVAQDGLGVPNRVELGLVAE